MTAVDWSRWRKCPVCFASAGMPCTDMTGTVLEGGELVEQIVVATRPHSTRKQRSGGAS